LLLGGVLDERALELDDDAHPVRGEALVAFQRVGQMGVIHRAL